jgi:transcriptional regulator with XRE-family HTH domain
LTQVELADRSGISVRAISDLERGLHRSARRDTVRMLADGLGLGTAARRELVETARRAAPTWDWCRTRRQRNHEQPHSPNGRNADGRTSTS